MLLQLILTMVETLSQVYISTSLNITELTQTIGHQINRDMLMIVSD